MRRLTYRGSKTMTEDGWIRPSYSCYSTRRIIERLAEYEDAEEKGLLLRLPVPIGTTVYEFEPLYVNLLIYSTTFANFHLFPTHFHSRISSTIYYYFFLFLIYCLY